MTGFGACVALCRGEFGLDIMSMDSLIPVPRARGNLPVPLRRSARVAAARLHRFRAAARWLAMCFSNAGIRATTLEVAERAGVSEGALFQPFQVEGGLFGPP